MRAAALSHLVPSELGAEMAALILDLFRRGRDVGFFPSVPYRQISVEKMENHDGEQVHTHSLPLYHRNFLTAHRLTEREK